VRFGRYLFKMLVGTSVGRWVGMRVTHFKFICEKVDGEEFTFNLNI
jgi:hypothetical protein